MVLLYFISLWAYFSFADAYRNWFTMEGEAFALKCPNAEDNESITWHLSKTNETISTNEKRRIYVSGLYLWFLPTSIRDSGNYICVKRKSDTQTNETVSVTIHPYEQGICYYPEDLYSYTSGTLGSGKIYCPSIDKYKNVSEVKWYKDCKYLHGSRYAIEDSILYISDVNETDTGNYTCQFTYSHGRGKFNVSATRPFEVVEHPSPIHIEVLYPKDNDVIEVEAGSPKNLTCKALVGLQKQNLALSYWNDADDYEQYSQEYFDANKGYFTEATLIIKEVRKANFNVTFTCVVSNDMEYRRVRVTLRSKEPCTAYPRKPAP